MASPLVVPKARFFSTDGLPLAGGKVYSFIAGTATPKATFTTAGGTVPNANPVILDANGEADIWLGGAYKLRLTDENDVEQWTIDNVKEYLVAPAGSFTLVSSAPTVLDATTFTIPGDQTPYFFANQRVKFVTSTTTVYSRVVSAIFGAGVTTVVLASGIINVGAPVGAYAGLGHPGLPIDARHVAYGIAGQSVEDKIAAMEADFSGAGGGTVSGPVTFESVVVFEENVAFLQDVSVGEDLTVEGTIFGAVGRIGVIAEGTLDTGSDHTVIHIDASALAHIADGTYKRLRLRITDLAVDGDFDNIGISPKITFNGDTGANYKQYLVMFKNTLGGGDTNDFGYGTGFTGVEPNPGGMAPWDTVWGAWATIAKMTLSFDMVITGLLLEDRLVYHTETIGLAPLIQGLSEGRHTTKIDGEWATLVPLTDITITMDGNTNPKAHSGTYQLLGET